MSDSEEEKLELSEHALLALQQFYAEQNEQKEKFERLKQLSEKKFDEENEEKITDIQISMNDFKEDWELSQFWYDDSTQETLINEAIKASPENGWIACLCSPSVFVKYKSLSQFWYDDSTQETLINEAIKASPENGWIACLCSPSVFVKYKSLKPIPKRNVIVFEIDERFNVFGPEFVLYDYKYPLKFTYLPEKDSDKEKRTLKNKFDVVIMDPPFLSEECLVKASMTTRWILKENGKIIACTGRVQTQLIKRLLNCNTTTFEPLHRGGLSNEFCCFTNYESDFLKWKTDI